MTYTANIVWKRAVKRTELRTEESAHKTNKGSEHANPACTSRKCVVKKPEVVEVRTEISATSSGLRRTSHDSERSAVPQTTNVRIVCYTLQSVQVSNIDETNFDERSKKVLLRAEQKKVEGTTVITHKIQVAVRFLFDTCTG